MALAAEMEACLGGAAGCRAALFVDLDDGMVLAASGAGSAAAGDLLAAVACELLGRARPAALVAAAAGTDHALVATDAALTVVQQLADPAGRALCLTYPAETDPDAALAHARARQAAVGQAGLW